MLRDWQWTERNLVAINGTIKNCRAPCSPALNLVLHKYLPSTSSHGMYLIIYVNTFKLRTTNTEQLSKYNRREDDNTVMATLDIFGCGGS